MPDDAYQATMLITAAIILIALAAYTPYVANWDEHVYVHEAQYLESGGENGFLEPLRPLGYPVLLAATHATTTTTARLVTIGASLAMFAAFHVALRRLNVDPWTATTTASLTAITPYVAEATIGARPMPIAFLLAALSVIAFSNDDWAYYVVAGAAATTAFYTRAVYGAWVLAGLLTLTTSWWREDTSLRSLTSYVAGCSIPFFGFSALYYSLYAETAVADGLPRVFGAVYPVYSQLIDHASKYVWLHSHGPFFYVDVLIGLTPFFIFALVPLYHARYKSLSWTTWYVAVSTAAITAFLFTTPHKEPRYLLAVLPWLLSLAYLGTKQAMTIITDNDVWRHVLTATAFLITVLPGFIAHVDDETAWHKREYQRRATLQPLPFDATDAVLLGTPVVDGRASYTVGYYDDEYFLNELRTNQFDGVVYDEAAFPCQDRDESCWERRETIQRVLNETYEATQSSGTTTIYVAS